MVKDKVLIICWLLRPKAILFLPNNLWMQILIISQSDTLGRGQVSREGTNHSKFWYLFSWANSKDSISV